MKKALLKRFDALEITTADLADAVSTYQSNFGFAVEGQAGSESAAIKVGGAQIRLTAAGAAPSGSEGLAALWLEADDVDQVAAGLANAGMKPSAIRVESGRRILAIDPKLANQVTLLIFDRKG